MGNERRNRTIMKTDKEKLEDLGKFLEGRIKQIKLGIDDTDMTLGADIYTILPIDDDDDLTPYRPFVLPPEKPKK